MSNEAAIRLRDMALLFFKTFCATVMFFALSVTLWIVGPAVETRYFPVVSKLRILGIEANQDGNTVISAEFTKLRDCEYVGLAWFRGSRELGFERVPIVLMRDSSDTSSPNRPLGTQRVGPWIIGIPPAEVPGNSFARLSHRCHGLWLTMTDFYP